METEFDWLTLDADEEVLWAVATRKEDLTLQEILSRAPTMES